MENSEREKILNRITQLIGKALDVKATHRPNPPNVISSVTLNKGAFSEWKNSVESFILKVAGENSHFYKNFQKEVKYESKSHVDAGVGILMAIKESIEQGDLSVSESKAGPNINASGGAGGQGGDGPGGGRGGDGGDGGAGGSVHFVQVGKEFTREGITIQDIKNPHRQYWGKLIRDFWKWFKEHILTAVIVGLIIAGLVYWLGWN
ncbi:MAG: hypothetical protein WAP55_01875 [Minisyncoccia bacterium]